MTSSAGTERAAKIAALLSSRSTPDRIRAIGMLAASEVPGRAAMLARALRDRSHYVAAQAAELLGDGADETVADAMVAAFLWLNEAGLERDPGCHIRSHLAFAFGRLEYRPAIPALRIGLRTVQMEAPGGVPFDTGSFVRASSALALAKLHHKPSLRDVALLLFDTAGPLETRKASARALALFADESALIPLHILLHASSGPPELRQECMQAIVDLEDERALEVLEPLLDDYDQDLAAFAAVMIAQTRAEGAEEAMKRPLERLSGKPLRAVVLAICSIRSEAASALLESLTEHPRQEVRIALVAAIWESPSPHGDALLRRLASRSGDELVAAASRAALVERGVPLEPPDGHSAAGG